MTERKKIKKIKEKLDFSREYLLEEAVDFIKKNKAANFDESIEVHLNLAIDLKKTEQMVKGSVTLPYSGFSQKKIAVFVEPEKEKEAKESGADVVGGKNLIDEIKKSGKADFDIAVATPGIMKELVILAKTLGPKGLMPSPKNGTITDDIKKTVAELKKGKISFKNDEGGNIHQIVGKISWEDEKIVANLKSFLEAVRRSKPAKVKSGFIKNIVLCSSMGPGIKIKM